MSIFKKIGLFFVGLFNAAKKAYSNLTNEQQAALQNGSGIVDIINENIGKAPAEIRALLRQKFPDLDEAKLENVVKEVCEMFNLPVTGLDAGIEAIQQHIDKFDAAKWAVLSHSVAAAFSALFAPADTKVATIVSLIEWVYQHFFKKATDTDEESAD